MRHKHEWIWTTITMGWWNKVKLTWWFCSVCGEPKPREAIVDVGPRHNSTNEQGEREWGQT